jgi:transposase
LARVAQEHRDEIEALLRRRDLPPRVRERAEMVKALAVGHAVSAICAWSGCSGRTVQRWLERFATLGAAGLTDAPRGGRPPKADARYLARLDAALEQGPRALGLPFDGWTSPRLSAYLAAQTGVRLAPGWLRVVLQRRGYAHGRPKHTVRHLRTAAEVTACTAELQAVGGKGRRGPGALRAAPPG